MAALALLHHISDFIGLEWGLRICISHKFNTASVGAASLGTLWAVFQGSEEGGSVPMGVHCRVSDEMAAELRPRLQYAEILGEKGRILDQ